MDPKTTDPRAAERPLLSDRSSDDQDAGWDWREDSGNDDRLREDVPPHW
ncbi:hypothetical protein [Actinocorallia libanotica]|uniref:Uncharacterized protein n=1 Tax=Actinocorallia libanotica TaxID=46162 RepID=A0ABP4BTB4_9ACTN